MSLWETLTNFDDAWPLLLRPGLIGAALCAMCGVLSVPVVLKRLSFAGQGISHSAFGGIGVAAVVGVLMAGGGAAAVGVGQGGLVEFGIVLVFCIGAAMLMSSVGDRKTTHEDTGIGMLLVAAMALGGLLVEVSRQLAVAKGLAPSARTWESVLFGSVMVSGDGDVWLAWGVATAVIAAAWWWRRGLLFWTLDEQSAPVFGVPARRMRALLMALLAVAVVTSMKLAGVVPATALLVLPGAIALRLSKSLRSVIALAVGTAVAGLVAALLLAVALNIQPGPALVLVLTGIYGGAAVVRRAGA
ncbi:MAG TPA: metal ABC transporter permease [Phycisphaerales bacterium]|nr:metal ABC transporter permease [Phycisphaerales bacterium]